MHKPVDFSLNSLEVVFSNFQTNYTESKLIDLINEKYKQKQHFYGIEVSSTSQIPLNYNSFVPILPLFTSIVWIGKYFSSISPIEDVPALECAKNIRKHTTVLPHITCYNLTSHRLNEFLQLNMSNLLVLRGDTKIEQQTYQNAIDLVKEIRVKKNDSISIGVGGYPDTHPDASSREKDLLFLKEKVDAGADFIITQFTFSVENLLNFVKDCRRIGITVPIIPGILVPENIRSLRFASSIARVNVPEELLRTFESKEHDEEDFKNFSIDYFVKFVNRIFESDLDIYGVQFFTLNRFDAVQRVIKECF